jgi:alkanesulfonate monooxygenase SsuD/methylene tetrahydromethanopterin reductase-like flavin-dependent oxidoreductase (luciferase family)
MDFGVATSTRGALGNREGYIAAAERAERLGFGFISVNDHVVVPRDIASRYPYSESGEWAGRTAGECLDQLSTLAFLAGRTERLRLLTSVMVVPQRHPVLTAKMLATIDILCSGSLIVGCGVGWLQKEFEALGAPPYAERGRHRRVPRRLQGALDQDAPCRQTRQRRHHLRAQAGAERIRPSGSAARAPRRSSGRCAWAAAGIRPPAIPSIVDTPSAGQGVSG